MSIEQEMLVSLYGLIKQVHCHIDDIEQRTPCRDFQQTLCRIRASLESAKSETEAGIGRLYLGEKERP